MSSWKHVVLAAVFIGLGLFSNIAVMAQTPLTPTGAEPNATGFASLADAAFCGLDSTARYSNIALGIHSGTLTLHCEGLTPGVAYRIGPTQVSYSTKKNQKVEPYAYVTASSSGTLDLVKAVTFYGSLWQWVAINPYEGYYEPVEYYPYEFSVDRKVKKGYSAVLTGCLW